jgi:sugar phosphate isomerase/epimerase
METHAMNDAASTFNRRDFLRLGVAGATASLVSRSSLAADRDPYAGFKMGIQSYSLRGFKVDQALAHSQTLGLKYWESFPGHIPLSAVPKHIAEQKQRLADAGVTLISYGVVAFDANESKAREMFEFAKGMGMKALSADPAKDTATFDLLDKLVAEYDVAIAIHNHGPKSRYSTIRDVWNQINDRHPKLGACVDTGHYLRSDVDPVEAIETFGKRVYSVHLKDVKTIEKDGRREKHFKIVGEGDLDVLGCLKALRKLNYDSILALEYEENPENPLSDLEICLKNVREAAAKLGD